MFRLLPNFQVFHDEPAADGKGPSGDGKELDTQDVINLLGEDEDKEEPLKLDDDKGKKKDDKEDKDDDKDDDKEEKGKDKDDDKDDEDEDEDKDELEELVEELDQPDEEKLELTTPVRRREILSKYPNLFKDFPYLEKAYYREQQFTEIFPTIDDARGAQESSQTLDKFEKELMGGNVETILKAVADENKNSFYKIVDELLPTLAKIDERAYHHLLGNNIKHTIVAMVEEAKTSGNEVLQSAAQVLHQFVFGNSKFEPPTKLAQKEDKDKKEGDDKLSERERAFLQQQFNTAKDGLNTKINNVLKSTIDANIDPKQSMTDYVKKNAIRECQSELQKAVSGDKRFIQIIDRLWDDAFKKNFSKDSLDRIRSAYLSKCKTLLPAVIKKARNEALKGMGKRVKEDDTDDKADKGGPIKRGDKPRSEERQSGKIKSGKDIPAGMTTLEFLNSD